MAKKPVKKPRLPKGAWKKIAEANDGSTKTQVLGTNPKDLLGMKKVSVSKVPPAALIYAALAMGDGAVKYGPYNWRKNKVIASIYVDAMLRHTMAWFDGEELAEDSQRPHLAHAMACFCILIDALETGNLVDDRPEPGAAAALIKKFTVTK